MSLPLYIRPEDHGFEPFQNEHAHNGFVFLKNGKKWIQNIEALIMSTGMNEESLENMGYAVKTYREIERSLSLFPDLAA
jgi:hypothetical protein